MPEKISLDQLVMDGLELVENCAKRHATRRNSYLECRSDGLVGLFQAASSYEPEKGPFRTWASRRISGNIIDEARTKSLYYSRSTAHAPQGSITAEVPDDRWNPEQIVLEKERLQEVHGLVGALRDRWAYIVDQHAFADRTLTDIGREIGVSPLRASQMWVGSLKAMRKALG